MADGKQRPSWADFGVEHGKMSWADAVETQPVIGEDDFPSLQETTKMSKAAAKEAQRKDAEKKAHIKPSESSRHEPSDRSERYQRPDGERSYGDRRGDGDRGNRGGDRYERRERNDRERNDRERNDRERPPSAADSADWRRGRDNEGSSSGGDRFASGFNRGGGRDGARIRSIPANTITEKEFPTRPPFIITLQNIKFSATEDDIGQYLTDQGAIVNTVTFQKNAEGRFSGVVEVEVDNLESVKIAAKLDGTEFMTRSLRVLIRSEFSSRGNSEYGSRGNSDFGSRGNHPEHQERERPRIELQPRTLPLEDRRPPAPIEKKEQPIVEKSAPASESSSSSRAEAVPRHEEKHRAEEHHEKESSVPSGERKKVVVMPRSEKKEEADSLRSASIFGDAKPVDASKIYSRKYEPKEPPKEEKHEEKPQPPKAEAKPSEDKWGPKGGEQKGAVSSKADGQWGRGASRGSEPSRGSDRGRGGVGRGEGRGRSEGRGRGEGRGRSEGRGAAGHSEHHNPKPQAQESKAAPQAEKKPKKEEPANPQKQAPQNVFNLLSDEN